MTKQAAPFRIWTTADREAAAPKEWVVEGLLGAGEVSGLVAPPTAGKSALALDLAATIAAGRDWFERKVSPGAALYFAPERGVVTLRRLKAFEIFHKVRGLPVGVVRDRIDLLHGNDDAERVLAAVKTYEESTSVPVRLITIDTARAAMPGGDENSPRDMGLLSQRAGRIRDGAPKAHVQLIHHTPKGRPAEASGHTALAAMLDVVIVVTVKGERRSWRISEANDLPALPPALSFTLQSVAVGADGTTAPVVVSGAVSQAATAAQQTRLPPDATTALDVLKGLTRGNGARITVDRWRDATFEALGDRKPATKRQAWNVSLKRLVDAEKVTVDGESVSVSDPSG